MHYQQGCQRSGNRPPTTKKVGHSLLASTTKPFTDLEFFFRTLDEIQNGPPPKKKKGRRSIVSTDVINKSRDVAEERDLAKDSATSGKEILEDLDNHRRTELEENKQNRHATLPPLSTSTKRRYLKNIVPIRVKCGGVQSTSRQRALQDPRNALSYAATWSAVTASVVDPRQVHSWDKLSVELNGFGQKKKLYLSKAGSKRLSNRNLNPATTANQGKRRTIKFGISKCVKLLCTQHDLSLNYLLTYTFQIHQTPTLTVKLNVLL